ATIVQTLTFLRKFVDAVGGTAFAIARNPREPRLSRPDYDAQPHQSNLRLVHHRSGGGCRRVLDRALHARPTRRPLSAARADHRDDWTAFEHPHPARQSAHLGLRHFHLFVTALVWWRGGNPPGDCGSALCFSADW